VRNLGVEHPLAEVSNVNADVVYSDQAAMLVEMHVVATGALRR